MKTKLLISLFALFISALAFSQTQSSPFLLKNVSSPVVKKSKTEKSTTRNANCATDTLFYSLLKEMTIGNNQFGAVLLTMPQNSGIAGASQTFTVASPTQTTSITGVSFYAFIKNAVNINQPMNVNVSVYSVTASNAPNAVISSATATVSATTPGLHSVNFTNPVVATGNYAVVIEAHGSMQFMDTLAVLVNLAQTTNYGEGLAHYKWSGWGVPSSLFGANAAYEPLIAPVISYLIATDYSVSPTVACVGTPVYFTNQTTPGFLTNRMYSLYSFLDYFNFAPNDSTFEWNFGDATALKDSMNAQHTYASSGTFISTLTTNAGFWNSCLDSDVYTVIVNPTPTVTVNSQTICSGAFATLTATPSIVGGTYVWNPTGATASSITDAPTTTTSYTVNYTSLSGCIGTATGTIMVNPNPVASFTTNTANVPTVVFTSTSTNATAHLWNFGDGSPTGSNSSEIHTYTAPGIYTVTLTVANACGIDTATQVITIISIGINTNDVMNEIKMYPNPSTGIIYLQLNTTEKIKMEIVNVLGEIVGINEFTTSSTTIDLSVLSKGVYYVRFSSLNGIQTKQLVITK